MRNYLRFLSAIAVCMGVFVFGVGVQEAGAVTTLTSLGWCRGPLAKSEVLTPLPAAASLSSLNSPSLAQPEITVQDFTEHVTLLQDTAPTTGIAGSLGSVATDALNALGYLSSAEGDASLVSEQSDEELAASAWSATSHAWGSAVANTKGFCGAVGRSITYITQDWMSSCTLPTFLLNVRWSNGTVQRYTFKQSTPGPWLVKTLGKVSLPMWVQADWSPGTPGRGITSAPGTLGGCNEETPGYPYSLSE
jgi:hypothetical protein